MKVLEPGMKVLEPWYEGIRAGIRAGVGTRILEPGYEGNRAGVRGE